MSTYYGDYPEEVPKDFLLSELKSVFACGAEVANMFGCSTPLQFAKVRMVKEIFDYMVEWRFPDLDELKSAGALQHYIRELENTKGKQDGREEG